MEPHPKNHPRMVPSRSSPIKRPKLTRRRLIQGVGFTACLAAAGELWLVEPKRLALNELDVRIDGLPQGCDGLKIAQLSDFHYGDLSDGELIRRAVNIVNGLTPDLIVLTGDYVTFAAGSSEKAARSIFPCSEILADLRAPLGVFASLGNHDECDPRLIARTLESRGIAVLRNMAIFVERAGTRLWIAGIEDVLSGRARLDQALQSVPEGGTTILLAHEPDFADVAQKYPVALQLSGHSHGGQVNLPVVESLYLPSMARKYPAGIYRLGNLCLYTNRGLGTVLVPIRFNSPPEVTLLTLRTGLPATGATGS